MLAGNALLNIPATCRKEKAIMTLIMIQKLRKAKTAILHNVEYNNEWQTLTVLQAWCWIWHGHVILAVLWYYVEYDTERQTLLSSMMFRMTQPERQTLPVCMMLNRTQTERKTLQSSVNCDVDYVWHRNANTAVFYGHDVEYMTQRQTLKTSIKLHEYTRERQIPIGVCKQNHERWR